jgi:hypothetical protein
MIIAMWSGPRNLSTALMYSFAARGDCAVWDEPFYAAYLAATGLDHPMRQAILDAGHSDPEKVASACTEPLSGSLPHSYHKQMAHHMLPDFPRDFMQHAANVFLIRHPARVIASYAAKREAPTLADLGFVQQAALFDAVAERTGTQPLVVDSADIRADPERVLSRLCAALGIAFLPAMLGWPKGPKPYDGAWAPHWYNAVHASTGFGGAEGAVPDLTGAYQSLCEDALPLYHRLRAHALGSA